MNSFEIDVFLVKTRLHMLHITSFQTVKTGTNWKKTQSMT